MSRLLKGLDYQVLDIGPMKLAGPHIQIEGDGRDTIMAFWHSYFAEGGVNQIPDRKDDSLFGIYCQRTENSFAYLIGVQVETFENTPEKFSRIELPVRPYAVCKAEGELPASVYDMWDRIDKSKMDRSPECDFEIYPHDMETENTGVTICVGLQTT